MMCVEVPVKTLRDEIDKMSRVDTYHDSIYARGVADALKWLLEGGTPPSENERSYRMIKKAA